jgi:hypothetical protein
VSTHTEERALKNQKETIRKLVRYLNNSEKDGGFWLPNIQRPFVWRDDQIERLFDSILREYPIGTLLVWKTRNRVRRRKFIDNFHSDLRLTDFYHHEDDEKPKQMVLDGQQRLQSLFIGLCGSYEGKELYFDVTSGDVREPEDIRFHFKFLSTDKAAPPWFKFKDIVFSNRSYDDLADNLIEHFEVELDKEQQRKIRRNVALIVRTFNTEETLVYQELDSLDQPDLYTEDDVVEVFIRANSGGTRLSKSDLLFSLLISTWEEADAQLEELLAHLNAKGFEFDRDFILKTGLTLLGHGARYEVSKFRDAAARKALENHWSDVEAAIMDVQDYIYGKTFIKCDKALPSYVALIPLIYFRYHYPSKWKHAKGIETFLVRVLLSRAFSGNPDRLIDACVARIREDDGFDVSQISGVIRADGRSLEITPEQLLAMGYGSDNVHLIFNLWYSFNYTPAFRNNLPQVDHVFPQSLLRKVKTTNPSTGRKDLMRWKESDRNQLANCMLLTQGENGAGGKWDTPPSEWFESKPKEYLDLHMIPADRDLWELDRFPDFVEARKALILSKFDWLLQPT